MEKIEIYRSIKLREAPEPLIELVRSKGKTDIKIDAAQLLAQYQSQHGDVLLVCDEDSPYEERLHFVLLRQNQIIDHLVYGGLYTPGIYKEVSCENNAVRFTFASDQVLTLALRETPSRWNNKLPPGARHRGSLFQKHYLILKYEIFCAATATP
jgi:hypothetical protein